MLRVRDVWDNQDVNSASHMQRAMTQVARAGFYIDPINKAKADYVRGDIEIEEFERQVEVLLSGKPVAYLQPGERVLSS